MATPFVESARMETPHTPHVNLVSIDSFWSPNACWRRRTQRNTSPAGQREQAIPGWMMVIPPGAGN